MCICLFITSGLGELSCSKLDRKKLAKRCRAVVCDLISEARDVRLFWISFSIVRFSSTLFSSSSGGFFLPQVEMLDYFKQCFRKFSYFDVHSEFFFLHACSSSDDVLQVLAFI